MRRSLSVATACLSLALVACSAVEKNKQSKELTEQQAAADVCTQLAKVGNKLVKASQVRTLHQASRD